MLSWPWGGGGLGMGLRVQSSRRKHARLSDGLKCCDTGPVAQFHWHTHLASRHRLPPNLFSAARYCYSGQQRTGETSHPPGKRTAPTQCSLGGQFIPNLACSFHVFFLLPTTCKTMHTIIVASPKGIRSGQWSVTPTRLLILSLCLCRRLKLTFPPFFLH